MLIAYVTAALLAASDRHETPCPAVVGVERVTTPTTRWLIVGEPHGTNEVPDAFGDLACAVSRRRTVIVALELPISEQQAIDAFMASDGGTRARTSFLRSGIWTNALKDGRSSEAMFRLFERLRRFHRQGRIDRVVAFQPTAAVGAAAFERAMADALLREARKDRVVVVLVGNVHAGLRPVSFDGPAYLPMAALLPRIATVTLDARARGGEQWACMSMTECGPQALAATGTRRRRIVVDPSGTSPYTGTFELGVRATASPPR